MNVMYHLLQNHLLIVIWLFSHVSQVASSSHNAIYLSSKCRREKIELFAELACSRNGSTYVAAKHGPSTSANGTVPGIDLNSSVGNYPWTYTPVCTAVVGSLGSELCVYTSTEFAAGRGISIITTPELATKFALLPSFLRESSVIDESSHSNSFRVTPETHAKGRRGVARQRLERGDEVASNLPILIQHHSMGELSWPEREEILRVAVFQIPTSTQQLLARLTSEPARDEFFLAGLFANHAGFVMNITGHKYFSLFPEMAFFNHDCAPNSHFYIDPSTLRMSIKAARDIPRGGEITISYFSEDRDVHLQHFSDRQQSIERRLQFSCACSRCHQGESADRALHEIQNLQQSLDDWSPGSSATPDDALRLIRRYEREGFDVLLDVPYGHAALAYNAVGDFYEAKRYAKLAVDILLANGRTGSPGFIEWRELARYPKQHWSWLRRT